MTLGDHRNTMRLSIRVTVVGMFLLFTSITAATAIGLQYYFSVGLATESALDVYREAGASAGDYLAAADKRAVEATRMLSMYPSVARDGRIAQDARGIFADTLINNPLFYAIYVGFGNGDVYELVNLDASPEVRNRLEALPRDRWVTIEVRVTGAQRQREYRYYDEAFRLRASRREPTDYFANRRPWFINAKHGEVHKTDPYLFQHLRAPGQTFSTRLAGDDAVLAIDIALSTLSAKLREYSEDGARHVLLYQRTGELIASSDAPLLGDATSDVLPLDLTPAQQAVVDETPELRVSNERDWPPFDFMVSGKPFGYSIDVLSLISGMTGLKLRYVNGYSWPELKAMFQSGELDVVHPVLDLPENTALGILSEPMADVPFAALTRRGDRPVTELAQLAQQPIAIPKGWTMIKELRQERPAAQVLEVDGIRGMFDAVRAGRARAGIDNIAVLRYTARQFFVTDLAVSEPLHFGDLPMPTTYHYLVHPAREPVVELINLALASLTPAQKEALESRWLISADTALPERSTVPYAALIELAQSGERIDALHTLTLDGKAHYVYVKPIGGDGPSQSFFAVATPVRHVLAPAIAKVKSVVLMTTGCFLLLLPLAVWMASQIVDPINRLAIENTKIQERRYRDLAPVASRIVEIEALSGSLRRMASSIERHAKDQEALMDAFIQVIAQAIDDKSPYTAGHCSRVPELAMMLARAAEVSDEAPFDRFRFERESDWREFRIGAWLHDCGKITTPEHIVDKGAKLEAIYNRIHEIRTRFEVLWRDAEIAYLTRLREAPEQEPSLRAALDAEHRQLLDDFAFVAACNLGGEHMTDEDKARLDRLSQREWLRNFDDRLGLSPQERSRMPAEAADLPAAEPLLADKPWHRVPRARNGSYPEHLGIRMQVPESLYDLGELYNLKVSRGTLTPEDRFKINEHMISTIRMLDKLPLPDELARVRRYATTHHEKLDGTGYPRQLSAAELSIPERIMVLADVFEALTASDRPYKSAMTISTAIEILHRMVLDEHVDSDVFRLFLRSGVYLDYARRYLPSGQIDSVELSRYLAAAPEQGAQARS